MTATETMDLGVDGTRVRAYRLSKGWTQQQLADRAGYWRHTIHHIETGHRGCQLMTLQSLAGALGVDMQDLLRGDPEAATLPPLAPRLTHLLDVYDDAPRGSGDAQLAAYLRACLSARDAVVERGDG